MRINRRLRISILTMMGIIALSAVLLRWGMAERAKRIAALSAELRRLEARLGWAEKMHRRGYLSKAEILNTRLSVQHVQGQLEELGAPAKGP